MKNKITRIFAVLLVVLMAVVIVPVMDADDNLLSIEAEAAPIMTWGKDGSLGDNVKWAYNKSNKTLTISGSGAMLNYLATPDAFAVYNGTMAVTIVNNATKIVINNGVTNIGNYVFNGFKNVTSVTIPASVKTIGNYAFSGCTALTSVKVPAAVTSIGTGAFNGCSALTTATLSSGLKTIGAAAFKGCSKLSTVSIPSTVTSIGSEAFSGCTALSAVSLNAGLTSIGTYAFNGCTKLASVTIPAGVTSLSNFAFNECTSLSSVTFNSGLKTIGERTFYNCKSLKSVTIPATVTTLGKSAFENCTSLSTVNLSEGLKTIGPYCFKYTKFAKVDLPYSVTSVGSSAFANVSGLNMKCNYGDAVYNYLKGTSYYSFRTPEFKLESSIDTAKKQLKVVVKVKNASGLNAANLNLTYNSNITPVAMPSISAADITGVAVNNSTGNISIAVMSEKCIPYTACSGECEYTIATFFFNINGTADTAAVSLSSKVFMSNDVKVNVATVSENFNLHVYTSSTITKTPTCKVAGERTYICSVCNKPKTEPVAIDPNNHAGLTELRNVKTATCKETGYTGDTYCKDCGVKTKTGTTIAKNATNHVGGTEVRNAKVANCKEQGYTGDTHCKGCNAITKAGTPIAKNANNHVGGTEIRGAKTANCKETGYTGDTHCKGCGVKTKTGTVTAKNANNHVGATELRNVKTVTCKEAGYTGDTHCVSCGAKTKTGTSIAKNTSNHVGGTEIRNAKSATCGAAGYTGDTHCKGCGTKTVSGKAIEATGKHTYNSGVITTAATCCATGVKTYTCSVCKATKTETVAKNAGNHVGGTEVRNAKAATCKDKGYTGDTHCKGCGTKTVSGKAIEATGKHTYNSGVITTAATCCATGVKTYTCSVCKATKTETVAKNAGNHVGGTEVRNAKPATCVSAGYTGDTYCKSCNVRVSIGKTITATGKHTYVADVTAPTCTEKGYTVYTCSVCDDTYTDDYVDATGHEFGATGKCNNCDEVQITEITFAPDKGLFVVENLDEETQQMKKYVVSYDLLSAKALLASVNGEGWSIFDEAGNEIAPDADVATSNIIKHPAGIQYQIALYGDVDLNGQITAADARLALRASAMLEELNTIQTLAADVDFNKGLTAADARMILRVSANLDVFVTDYSKDPTA